MALMHTATRQQADSLSIRDSSDAPGVVVVFLCKPYDPQGHVCMSYREIATRLAALQNFEFAGEFDHSCRYPGPLYFVPSDTLISQDFARNLGIHGDKDLFGGIVPFPFVGTKVITHPLADNEAHAPLGWSREFARMAHDAVLPGYSAFTLHDAQAAGTRLLQAGPVRIKRASGIGGLGQTMVNDATQLEAELASIGAEELFSEGVVIEQNLLDVVTQSVGQVRVGNLVATYYGTQRLTRNNRGQEVYGGSDLIVARGDFDALCKLRLPPEMHTAIKQAQAYHAAAQASFPDMVATRCNYDVAQGYDAEGRWRSGVLEQSWRIGGASGAEVAALEAFLEDPALDTVCASTTEVYGEAPPLPADAVIYCQGVDAHVGPITKYSTLKQYGNP